MRCTKCGSVVMLKIHSIDKSLKQYECIKCGYLDSKIDYDKREHQARLDKVLSKFKFMPNVGYWEYNECLKYLDVMPLGRKNEIGFWFYGNQISLDTVESLIKDLEVER